MIRAQAFIDPLRRAGYTHYSWVPCSFLKPFINCVINADDLDYVGAASEGEAVGISLGAHLAGRKTVTMCQNSGLGNMIKPLTSLNFPFRVPGILIVTWRGEPGQPDEPQHEQMGEITHRLLETMDIPWREFPREADEIDAAIAEPRSPFLGEPPSATSRLCRFQRRCHLPWGNAVADFRTENERHGASPMPPTFTPKELMVSGMALATGETQEFTSKRRPLARCRSVLLAAK